MAIAIHPTAVVHPEAVLEDSVRVGPYAVIGAKVHIGPETEIGAHAVIEGPTTLGRANRVYPFVSLGQPPQDLKYRGEPTVLTIGEGNTFREFVTVHRGTQGGGGETRIGDHNLFMAYAHVAHDCRVGSHVVFVNNATLAGHVSVDDHAVLAGKSAVGQFLRVGESAFLAAGAMVSLDVPPFCIAQGDRARLLGLNVVGLRRRGFSRETIQQIDEAYQIVFTSALGLDEACARLETELADVPEVARFVAFLRGCQRGPMRP
jgi:UDP-N-acetylglucosamine acyltransferase